MNKFTFLSFFFLNGLYAIPLDNYASDSITSNPTALISVTSSSDSLKVAATENACKNALKTQHSVPPKNIKSKFWNSGYTGSKPLVFADPTEDLVFKGIFGAGNDRLITHFLWSLNNEIFPKPLSRYIKRFYHGNSEVLLAHQYAKKSFFDVCGVGSDGMNYILEMERGFLGEQNHRENFRNRLVMYAARVYGNQLFSGQSYSSLRNVHCIAVIPHSFSKSTSVLDSFAMPEPFSDHLRITVVQVANFSKDASECRSPFDHWMYLFSKGHRGSSVPKNTPRTVAQAYRYLYESANNAYHQNLFTTPHDRIGLPGYVRAIRKQKMEHLARVATYLYTKENMSPSSIAKALGSQLTWVKKVLRRR